MTATRSIAIILTLILLSVVTYSLMTHTDRLHDTELTKHGAHEPENHHSDHGMMMVESEREFLEGMIPHHQEAVDTAREVLARGASTPEIKQLAEEIIVAQEQEIALMKAWYQSWYGEAYVPKPEAYTPMMRDLSSLSGAALDRVFLEDMVMHHMGAIMMAQSVLPHIEHPEVRTLTDTIITTQTAEIELMQSLLQGL